MGCGACLWRRNSNILRTDKLKNMIELHKKYIITLIIFPRTKPYLKGIIDNEYVLDIVLGVTIFVIVVFLILMIFFIAPSIIRPLGDFLLRLFL